MAGKKGMKRSRGTSDAHKDAIALAKIENTLDKHTSGEIELTATQLKAIELRYARLRPTLSAVEQTIHDDPEGESDLLAQFQALLLQHPELAIALQQAVNQPKPSTDTHVSH